VSYPLSVGKVKLGNRCAINISKAYAAPATVSVVDLHTPLSLGLGRRKSYPHEPGDRPTQPTRWKCRGVWFSRV